MFDVSRGSELEDLIEAIALECGWRVEKRRRHGKRILDLVLSKGGVVFIVQAKNKDVAQPRDVSQTRKDYEEYINYLIRERLGLRVASILVSRGFSDGAKRRARGYGVRLYRVEELRDLLS